MALDKVTLKAEIITLTAHLFNNSSAMTPADARDFFANGLADAIEKYVKSGDGIYQTGRLQAGSTPVTPNGLPAIKIV